MPRKNQPGCPCDCSSPPPSTCSWFCGTVVVFSSFSGSGAAATAQVNGGTITSVTVTAAGAGYTSSPTVTFAGPFGGLAGSGTGATAVATIGGGQIASVEVSPGTGYVAVPTVTFSPPTGGPPGITATGTATLGGGNVNQINITDGGSGYNHAAPPVVTFSPPVGGPPGGTTATGTAVIADFATGAITSITIDDPGSFYTEPPSVFIGAPPFGGTQATADAEIGGIGVVSITLTKQGSFYYTAPTITIEAPPPGGTQAMASATITPVGVTGVMVTNGGSGYVSGNPPPTAMEVTISCDNGAYGPFILNGLCAWSLATNVAVQGSLCGGTAGLNLAVGVNDGGPFFAIGLGASPESTYQCPPASDDCQFGPLLCCGPNNDMSCAGGPCPGDPNPNPGGPVPGDFGSSSFQLGVALPACTARPYSASVTQFFGTVLASVAPQFWPFFNSEGDCNNAPLPDGAGGCGGFWTVSVTEVI